MLEPSFFLEIHIGVEVKTDKIDGCTDMRTLDNHLDIYSLRCFADFMSVFFCISPQGIDHFRVLRALVENDFTSH